MEMQPPDSLAESPACSLPSVESAGPTAARIVDAAELLRGNRVVLIDHHGSLYRLSLTRNDRLVLQK